MNLAIFDLDHTLLGADSDELWGQFLGERGHVDLAEHLDRQARFLEQYLAGTLDIGEYTRFQLGLLARHDDETLAALRDAYLEEKVAPVILPKAEALIEEHRAAGHTLLIATATNRYITEPIAKRLGVEHLIATEPRRLNNRYTGEVEGIPSFREGKFARVTAWTAQSGHRLEAAWFYSDSRNDLPLLERVGHPVAVDPDPALAEEARRRGWPVISLR